MVKFIDKVLLFINSVIALSLLLSVLVTFLPPVSFPVLSLLSLIVAPLFFANCVFLIFWILRVKKQLLVSLLALLISAVQFNLFYQFDFSKESEYKENQLHIMSYNVRIFNLYDWIKDIDVLKNIEKFISHENPDVISFQEYYSKHTIDLKQYPYSYVKIHGNKKSFGQAIYSKYPIVAKGSLDFNDTANNALYIDIVKNKDTLRVYNIHLESLQINPDDVDFNQNNSQRLARRMALSFKKQQQQVELIEKHMQETSYPIIITADINNTAFSYVYRKLKSGKKDAFAEKGKGLGTTYFLKKIPLRIDFILVDKSFTVNEFNTYTHKYSDHLPISAVLSWE